MSLVLPGDYIKIETTSSNQKEIIIGPGLRKENDLIIAIKCGILREKDKFMYWIDDHSKRYVPARNEHVIGVVVNKTSETFKLDIGSSEHATISYLAFENATKRNKPNVDIGDLLYCKILTGNKDIEPECVCIDSNGKANGMGVLAKGFAFRVSLDLCRRLLSKSKKFLTLLGKEYRFEVAIGFNGIIWLKSDKMKDTITLANAISSYSTILDDDTESYVKKIINENK